MLETRPPFSSPWFIAGLAAVGLLLSACQRPPTYKAPPPEIPQAQLTYTSNLLEETSLGFANGVSGVYLFHSGDYCRDRQMRPLGDIQQVSKDQRETTVSIPAVGDTIFETFWKNKDGGCLTSLRGFRAQPGVAYRLSNHTDLAAGSCKLMLEQREAGDEVWRPAREPVRLENYCGAERLPAMPGF